MAEALKTLTLEQILEPDEALRKVDRKNEQYLGLVESIRSKGVMNPITVRELESENGNIVYAIVDGLQRFNASKDAGKESIPCHVMSIAEGEEMDYMIIGNVHKVDTKPVEYSKGLLKILQNNPLLSRSELAERLSKTPAWISERLGLLKLHEDVAELVDEHKIGLSNAYSLTKLDHEEQKDFVDRAMTMPPQQFAPTVNARLKEIREARRKGKDADAPKFSPVALLRSKGEIISEAEVPSTNLWEGCATPKDAFVMALNWVLQLDPESVEIQRANYEEREEAKKAAREAAKVERRRKAAKEAAEKAAALQKEAEELASGS